ncbi:hypothetical protein [Paraclostridium bifermentans]|uniref:hypothetical protein n=1 Tax=Paraclostridium bifermentans TaxID=1490 RepID=UPI00374FA8CA
MTNLNETKSIIASKSMCELYADFNEIAYKLRHRIKPNIEFTLETGDSKTPSEMLNSICNNLDSDVYNTILLSLNIPYVSIFNSAEENLYNFFMEYFKNEYEEIVEVYRNKLEKNNLSLIGEQELNLDNYTKTNITNLNFGDIVLYQEKRRHFEVYASGMVGNIIEHKESKSVNLLVNDSCNQGKGVLLPLNTPVYKLSLNNITNKDFKDKVKFEIKQYYKN